MGDLSADEFVERLQQCLQFLANHGFKKAADAVFEQLDGKTVLDQELRQETPSSASHDSPDFADQPSDGERRSRSAGAVLRHEPPEEYDAARESQEQGPWQPGSTLTTRLSGSQRLYEDPDIDEYNCMEDVGYIRQPVPHQHEFVLRQLDLQDNDHEAYLQHASSQHHSNNDSPLSDSGSSSASLSSPGMSSSKPYHSATSLLHDEYQQQDHQQGLLLRTHTSQSAPTGDAAWDSGPAGITFAEPVTTPTKEGRHSTASEPKQSLSRVESLSNSFIDELESCQGDEAGSITGDISTPALRRSTQTALRGSSSDPGQIAAGQQGTNTHEDTPTPSEAGDVIDLSPPSPPPDCAADAAIDFSNIFELGLRGSSRTSSVEVLYGSTKGWSETNSEVGDADSRPQLQGAEAGGGTAGPFGLWAAFGGVKKQKSASKLQPPPQLEEQQQYQQQQLSAQQQQQHQDLQQLGQGESSLQQQEQQQLEQPLAAAEPSQQQEQQLQSSSYGVSGGSGPGTPDKQTAYGGTAATAGSLGVGFGFSFPTTSPSAVDAAVHEERAERVFSSWASNHSRCGADAAGASDDEDSSSSKPAISIPSSASGSAEGQMLSEGLWELPATPMAMVPVAPAAAAVSQSTIAATTPVCAGSHTGSGAGDPAVDVSTEAAAAAVLSDAKIPPVAVGVAPTAQHPGSSGAAVNELHRLGSSSDAAATQAAAAAPALAEAATQPAAEVHKAAAADEEPGNNDRGAMRPHSTAVEGEPELLQREGSGYNESMAAPATDADMASTETGGFSGSGELPQPRYVIDEAGNLLYEYDSAYVEARYETFDLRIIHRRRRTGFEDSKDFPIRKNDLIAGRYQVMDFLGSAAFSQAVQALDTATGALVCLKIIKNNKDYFDQSLDEIKLLRYVNGADPEDEHHIVRLYDFFYYKEHLFLVCELLRANLYEFQKYQRENGDEPYFTSPRIQRIAIQVLQSLAFLHSLSLVHSDLKPENILIKSYSRCEVKVIDLGSSCFITDHLSSYVQSRSYRAPEVILGLPYGQKVDIWSLGCILAELATGYVLFQNDSLATLLVRLEGILGPLPSWMISQGRYSNRYYTKSRQIYERNKATGRYELLLPKHTSLRHRVPGADEGLLDFLSYLLTPDSSARPTAEEALQHPWLAYPYPPAEQISD